MGFLSFNEKAWDKVRPGTLKKTGVSEAIRAFEKGGWDKVADFDSIKACSDGVELLDAIADKLKKCKTQLDAKKHADALKSIGSWLDELENKRESVQSKAGEIAVGLDKRLEDAHRYITRHDDEAVARRGQGQEFLSAIQDLARNAVLAGAKGDSKGMALVQQQVTKATHGFITLRNETRNWFPKVQRGYFELIPRDPELADIKKLQAKKNKIDVLFFKVKAYVDYFEELEEEFEDTLKLVENAGKSGNDQVAAFVKIVQADVKMCQEYCSKPGSTETAVDTDLKGIDQMLTEAESLAGEARAEKLPRIMSTLKDAVGKFKALQKDLDAADSMIAKKTDGYPDFVNADNKLFKQALEDFESFRRMLDEIRTKSLPKFRKRGLEYGARLKVLATS